MYEEGQEEETVVLTFLSSSQIMNSVYVTLRDQLGRVNRPLSAEEVLQAAAQIIRSCTIDGLAQLEKSAAATSEKEETEKEGEQEATPVAVEAKREAEGVVSAAPVTAAAVSSPAPPKKEEVPRRSSQQKVV